MTIETGLASDRNKLLISELDTQINEVPIKDNANILKNSTEETVLTYHRMGANLYQGSFIEVSQTWPSPTIIISDGPYGLGAFPGDPISPDELAEWYQPYIDHWTERALPETTLWLWNTEIGWANLHPILNKAGWDYQSCHIWDKGIAHIAGNTNSKTLRRFPVVTELCVQYTRRVTIPSADGIHMSLKQWLRSEWQRTNLPFSKSNTACKVKNAATRKYLTQCELWYFPPPEAFELLVNYANKYGNPDGKPYFSFDGINPATALQWERMRSKFHCNVGITNVWQEPSVRGPERLKKAHKCIHMNQKPVKLIERIILASSDPDDIVWEPFGGLCSVAISAINTGRQCYSAEIIPKYFTVAKERLSDHAGS